MAGASMTYSELPAPPELHSWIHSFWLFEVEEGAGEIDHKIPLTGGALITVSRGSEPIFIGPRVAPLSSLVRGGDQFWGIHFRPGGATRFLRLASGPMRDATLPLRLVGPSVPAASDATEGLRLLAESAVAMATRAEKPDPLVSEAAEAIISAGGAVRIEEIAGASGLSPRQFRRRFLAETGLTAKELARLRRLRSAAAAAALEGGEWAGLATDAGFSDQPHLAREFRALLGAGPEAFRRHALRIRHQLTD